MADTPEWNKYTLANAGTIKDIAETAATLAEQIKTTSVLANAAMTTVKWIAELQSVNPFLSALDALADELLKAISDIKEAGYYFLLVDPYSPKNNVTPVASEGLGFEVLRDEAGRRIWWNPTADVPEATQIPEPVPFGPERSAYSQKLVYPRKLVAGGYNPLKDNTIDPFATMSPFPVYNAQKVLETISQAFFDEGDIPKYRSTVSPGAPYPKPGDIVFDDQGSPISGWDPNTVPEQSQQLWDLGSTKIDGSAHTAAINQGTGWKTQRQKINMQIKCGKPNVQGNTEFGGGSSALVFIIGAPSYKIFAESFNAFSKLFADVDALQAGVTQSIMDAYNAIVTPEPQVIKLTMCDSKYNLFAVGDVIRGQNHGGLGKIISVNSSATQATTIVSTATYLQTDDIGNTRRRRVEKDMNADSRFMDMEVTITPLPTKEAKGIENFTPQDSVYEQEAKGTWGTGDQKHPNYMIKGVETMDEPKALSQTSEKQAKKAYSPQSKRVYPKYGTVAMQKLQNPPDSTAPDFEGMQIGTLIPMWNEVFESIEGYIEQVKGYISTPADFIQDMIDSLNEVIDFLEELIKTIEDFLKWFEIDLSTMGIYALYIEDQQEGNKGLANQITSAPGLPDNLDYAAGVVLVGVEVAGFNALDEIAGPIFKP